MTWRAALPVILVVIPFLTFTANADVPLCQHVLVDPTGDTDVSTSPALGEDDVAALDVVAADLLTTATKVVVAVRVADLGFTGVAADNRQWWAHFSGRSQDFQFVASADALGSTAMLSARHPGPFVDEQLADPQTSPVQLDIDLSTDTVRMTGARSFFDAHGGLPATVAAFRVSTSRAVGLAGPGEGHITSVGNTVDAAGPAAYVTNTSTGCLRA